RQPERKPGRRLDAERPPAVDRACRPVRGVVPGRRPARPGLRLRDVPQPAPVRQGCGARGDGELLVVAAGPSHRLRWKKHLGASETSPLIVGNRIYVGDAEGHVYCLRTVDGKTVWTFHAGGAVKGALAFDRGRVFFGAYDGRLYALRASDGKQIWRAESARDWFGRHGTFYSTPSVAYSRVYLGSTDGHIYSFGEQSGKR